MPKKPQPPAEVPIPSLADGVGGTCGLGEKKTADVVRRAIKERWPIPDATREKLPKVLSAILENDQADARARVAAARALLEADKINQEQEKRDQQIPDKLDITSGGKSLDGILTVFDRIDQLTKHFAGADASGAPGDGS